MNCRPNVERSTKFASDARQYQLLWASRPHHHLSLISPMYRAEHPSRVPDGEATTRIRRANETEGGLSPRHSGPGPQAPMMNRGKWAWSLCPAAGISWIEMDGRRRTCNTTTTQSSLSSRPVGGGFETDVHCHRSFCRHAQ